MWVKDKAKRDEICSWCAYPFDIGDIVLARHDIDAIVCSKSCADNLEENERNRTNYHWLYSPAN